MSTGTGMFTQTHINTHTHTYTHVCICSNKISSDSTRSSFFLLIWTLTQGYADPSVLNWQSFLMLRFFGLTAISSSRCVLVPGAAWVPAVLSSLLSSPSMGVSRCIIDPSSRLRAIRHSLRSLPGVRYLRQPRSEGEATLKHLILIQWRRSRWPGVSSSFAKSPIL